MAAPQVEALHNFILCNAQWLLTCNTWGRHCHANTEHNRVRRWSNLKGKNEEDKILPCCWYKYRMRFVPSYIKKLVASDKPLVCHVNLLLLGPCIQRLSFFFILSPGLHSYSGSHEFLKKLLLDHGSTKPQERIPEIGWWQIAAYHWYVQS